MFTWWINKPFFGNLKRIMWRFLKKLEIELPHDPEIPLLSTLAWKIPWTEEPGRLQSMGSLRVGHDWVTSLSLFTFMHWRRKWQPTPVFLPGESQGRGSLVSCIYGVAQSRTQLKRLSSSSSSIHTEETRIERDTCTPVFIAALFIIARTRKQLRCPSADEWIRKL